LIALGGVAYLLRQWVEHGARFLGHINSRVLFHCYYLMFVVHGSSIAVMYVIDLARVRFDCVLLDFWIVITLRGLVLSTLLSSHIIFILMSIERLYSALYPEHFERSSAQRLTIVLAITVVASACFYIVWNATNGFQLCIWKLVPIAFIRVPANAEKYDVREQF
ncbi:hypothetical protein PRIPAC_95016, partial [Pristionchus pacificus]|uniref:Uncharacterized protein n=1 Tax=Pristionchus pacificus TaxID=54126 RepID=A0A2A6CE34_PRIPA